MVRRALLGIVKVLVLALAVLAVGCGSQALPMHGDVTFTAEQRQSIERGAEWLAEKSGGERVEIVWDLPHPADDAPLGELEIVRHKPLQDDGVHPGYCEGLAHISLDPAIEGDWLAFIAAHELAHSQLYTHHEGRGLMGRVSVFEWTPEDEASRGKTNAF